VPFADDFDGPDLDAGGVPHDLRMWSSRADSAATHTAAGSGFPGRPRASGPVPLLAVDEVRG
jgi:hypothetical protein